jgi:leader peptidase (prepilin peptidase)/N-methyltransferase
MLFTGGGQWQDCLLSTVVVFLVFLIGMTIFSYLNIVIEELPREEAQEPLLTRLTKGRSTCPHCGHLWKISESIPVVSWLRYRGKCGYCFQKISSRHTWIEISGGVLAAAAVLYYGVSVAALTVFLVFGVLMTIAMIDADTQYIPPELNILLALIGIVSYWTLPEATVLERIIGVACISVPMILIVLIVPGGFGWGDIKMMAASGVLLGWKGNVTAFFIGLILGGIYAVYLLLSKKKGRKEHFAFGPFLSIGIAVSMYAGIGVYLMNQYIGLIVRP